MKYTLEFKLEYINKYKNGELIEVPSSHKGNRHTFMIQVYSWASIYDLHGIAGLFNRNSNKIWKSFEKLDLVGKVLAGKSYTQVAIEAGINKGLLYSWVKRYREKGMEGLECSRKGPKPKNPIMTTKSKKSGLTQSEKEELILLKTRNEYLEAENAYLKKLDALVSKREAAHPKAKKPKSSKGSLKKTNIDD